MPNDKLALPSCSEARTHARARPHESPGAKGSSNEGPHGRRDSSPGWYAVYTKARSEVHVAAALERRGYETRIPMRRKAAVVARQEAFVTVPLFPRYVLVSCVPTALTREAVFGVRGVDREISRRSMTFPLVADVLAEIDRVDGTEFSDIAVSELMSWAFRPLGLN